MYLFSESWVILAPEIIAVDQATSCRRKKVLIYLLNKKPAFLDPPVLKQNPFMWKIRNNRVQQFLKEGIFFFSFQFCQKANERERETRKQSLSQTFHPALKSQEMSPVVSSLKKAFLPLPMREEISLPKLSRMDVFAN